MDSIDSAADTGISPAANPGTNPVACGQAPILSAPRSDIRINPYAKQKGTTMFKFKNLLDASKNAIRIAGLFMSCHGTGRWALALGALAVFSATFSATASAQNIADNAQFISMDTAGQPTPTVGACARFVIVRRANAAGTAFTETQKAQLGTLAVSFIGQVNTETITTTPGTVTFPAGADRMEFMVTTSNGSLVGTPNGEPEMCTTPANRAAVLGSGSGWWITLWCQGGVQQRARDCNPMHAKIPGDYAGYRMVTYLKAPGNLNFTHAGYRGQNQAANPAANIGPAVIGTGPMDQTIAPGASFSTLTGMAGFFQDGNAPGMVVTANTNGTTPYARQSLRFGVLTAASTGTGITGIETVAGLGINAFTGEFTGLISQHTPVNTTFKVGIEAVDYNGASVYDSFTLTVSGTSMPPPADNTPRMELVPDNSATPNVNERATVTSTSVTLNFQRVAGTGGTVSTVNAASVDVTPSANRYLPADKVVATIPAGKMTASVTITRTTANEPVVESLPIAQTITFAATSGTSTVFTAPSGGALFISMTDSVPYFDLVASSGPTADPFVLTVVRAGNNFAAADVRWSVTNDDASDPVAVAMPATMAGAGTVSFAASDGTSNRNETITVERTDPGPAGTGNGMITVSIIADPADPDTYGQGPNRTRNIEISRAPPANTAPTLVSNPTVEAAVQGTAYSMDLARFFEDAEMDGLTFEITTGTCAGFTIGGTDNGFLVGVGTSPADSVTATANTDCTVTANDGTVDSAPASFTIPVTVPSQISITGWPTTLTAGNDLTFTVTRTGGDLTSPLEWDFAYTTTGLPIGGVAPAPSAVTNVYRTAPEPFAANVTTAMGTIAGESLFQVDGLPAGATITAILRAPGSTSPPPHSKVVTGSYTIPGSGDGLTRSIVWTAAVTPGPQPVAEPPTPNTAVTGRRYSLSLARFFTNPDSVSLEFAIKTGTTCTGFAISSNNLVGAGTDPANSVTATANTTCTITASDGTNTPSELMITIPVIAPPVATADSFGISSDHTRSVTLSGNVLTGVVGTGLTTEGGATDIMLGADTYSGGMVSNLRVRFIQAGTTIDSSEATRVFDVAGSPSSKIDFISGQGSLAMNSMGEFTYTPPTGDFEFFFGVSPNRVKRAIAAGETATISVVYRIADMGSSAATADGVLAITVTGVATNAPPVPVDDPIAIDGDDASLAVTDRAMGVLANDTDDGDATALVVASLAQVFNATGNYDATDSVRAGTAFAIRFLGTTTPDLTNQEKVADFTLNVNGTYTLALVDSVFDHLLVGETEVFYIRYLIQDEEMAFNTAGSEGLITITVNGAAAAPNTSPTLMEEMTPMPVKEVTEDADNNMATGNISAMDNEQTTILVGGCANTTPGTNCTDNLVATGTGTSIPGIYGAFTLTTTTGGVEWDYDLDDTDTDTNALDGDDSVTEVLRIFADDGTSDITGPTSRFSETLVITITITGANDKPVITPATNLSMSEDDVVGGTLLGRAFAASDFGYVDPEGGAYSIVFAAGPVIKGDTSTSAGRLNDFQNSGDDVTSYPFGLPSSSFTNYAYVPVNRSANYTAQFTITPEDSDDLQGEQKTLEIMVTADNDAPTVVGTLPAVAPGTSGGIYRQALAGFFEDVDSTNLTYALSGTCPGFVIGGTDNGFLVGSDSGNIPSTVTTDTTCMVTATDGTTTSPPASLAIDITAPAANIAPVARDDLVEISPTDLLSLDPTSFDSDGYLYVVTTGNRTGQRPDPLPAGADTDPDGDDTALRVTRVAAGETLGSSPTDIPGTGSVEISGDNGAVFVSALGGFTYTPTASVLKALSPGGTLEDKFTYEISDGTDVATALYTIRITKPAAANSKPVLARGDSDKTSVTEAGGVANATAGDPSANGAFSSSDADNDTLTLQARASANSDWTTVSANATAIPGGVYGSLSVNTDGSWTYTLDNDCSSTAGDPGCATEALNVTPPNTPLASDDFSFRLDDGNTDNATRYSDVLGLQVSITGANDAPTVVGTGNRPAVAGGTSGAAYSQPLAGFFEDVDNDDATLTYALSEACTGFVIGGTGNGFLVGSESDGSIPSAVTTDATCKVTATDGTATSPAASLAIVITAVAPANTAPTLVSNPTVKAAVQGAAYSMDLARFFTDAEMDDLTFTITTGTCAGFTIGGMDNGFLVGVGTSPAGSVTATANTPCTVTANDGTVDSAPASFTIPVNVPPVPVDDPIAIDADDASLAVTARAMGVLANDTDDGDATKLVVTNFEQALSASGVYEGLSASTAGSALRVNFLGTTTPDLTNGQKVADFTLNENGTYTLTLVDSVFDHLGAGETELFYVLYVIRDEEMAVNAHRNEGLITITVNGAAAAAAAQISITEWPTTVTTGNDVVFTVTRTGGDLTSPLEWDFSYVATTSGGTASSATTQYRSDPPAFAANVATAMGTVNGGSLSVAGGYGVGTTIAVTLLPPDHAVTNGNGDLVPGSYTVPDSGDGLTRSIVWTAAVLPGPQPVADQPTPKTGVTGRPYSLSLVNYFTNPDSVSLEFAIKTGTTCTGFAISSINLVGAGTDPANSVTATADTTCTITASDGTNTPSEVMITIPVIAPPVATADSFGISSDHTRSATLSGNVITGVAGTGLTTEGGATDIMLGADTYSDGMVSNLRVDAINLGALYDPNEASLVSDVTGSPAATIGFGSGQGSLAMNSMGEFTYTPPTGDFEFFFGEGASRVKRAIAAGETGTIQATYRIVDMGLSAATANGVLTITVTGVAANTAPTLTPAASPDLAVTEDAAANDTAGGSFTVTDAEQTSVTVQRCVDAVAGTACTTFANAATGNIGGIYGNFTLTNAGAWTYTLDNQCGTTPGIQGTTADAGEADDPGCATDALASAATASDVLRIRADDGTADATTAAGSGTSRYSSTEVVTVTITGANDAPTVVGTGNRPAVAVGNPGGAYSQPLAGFFEDADTGTTLAYALSGTCTGFVIGGTDNGFLVGSDGGDIPSTVTTGTTCMVTATDGTATSPAASLAIVITATNDAPTAVADSFGISSDHTRTVTLSGNVITGVAGTGLTTEGGATDIMLGADSDDGGVSNLRVTLINSGDTYEEDEAQSVTSSGTTLTFSANQGSLAINDMGAFTYTPPTGDFMFQYGAFPNRVSRVLNPGESNTIRATYRIADMASPAKTADGVLTITVTGVVANAAPVAVADPIAIDGDDASVAVTARNMGVLMNDTDDGDATMLVVTKFEQASSSSTPYDGSGATTAGSAASIIFQGVTSDPGLTNGEKVADFTLNVNGTYTLTLVDSVFDYLLVGETELFYVRYQIQDDGTPALFNSGSDGLITITVNGAATTNDAPTAVADSFGISSDHTRTVTLSGNVITGVAGTGLTTEGGATDIMLGADSDDGGVSNLRVTLINSGDTYEEDEAQSVTSSGTTLTFSANQGSLAINDMGAFTYTPPTGDFMFQYGAFPNRVSRVLNPGESNTIRATYRIADMASPAKTADGVLTITVTAPPAAGSNTAPTLRAAASPDITVTEDAAANNTAGGSFTVMDAEQTGANAVTVQRCVDAVAGTACTVFANAATGNIGGIYGNFTLTNAGAWTYTLDNQCGTTPGIQGATADAGEAGDPGCATDALAGAATASDVLRIRADDGQTASRYSRTEVVTVTITGANDAPALAAGQVVYPDTVIMPGMAMSAIAGGRYADPESGTLTYAAPTCADAVTTVTLCGAGGTLPAWVAFDTTDGSFGPVTGQTVPDPFNGTMNITVTISDGEGGSVMDTFAITHRDLDPVVNADALTITEGGNDLTGNVYDNDTGVRGHPMDVTTLAGYNTGATFNAGSATTDHSALRGAYGSLTIMNDGAYTYSLDNTAGSAADMLAGGQMVMDVFTYRVSDKAAGTPNGDGVITVTITGVNDMPMAVAGILPSAIDGTQSVALVATALPDFDTAFSDSDGDMLTITAVASGLPAGLTYTAATRTLSGTPTATGAGTITVTATDGSGGTATVTIDVRVSARPGTGTTITPPMMTRTGDNMMMVAVTDPEAEVDSDENAADHGVQLKATAFGYQDMDARLASVTITTLPTPTSGRLVLVQRNEAGMGTGEAPVTENQTITRADLDAGNLVIVSNTSNGATVSFTFTTTGTEGNEATAIDADRPIGERTSTTMIGGKESMPEVLTRMLTRTGADGMPTMETVIGVGDQPAYAGRDFSYTIRLAGQTGQLDGVDVVWTNDDPSAVATPTAADIDPGDYDQDLTITITSATCAATVAEGCTMGASAIGADGWLEVRKVDGVPGMSTASYTLRSKRELMLSDHGDYTVALRITDGTTVITDTFTLQVNRLPMYNITNVVHDKEKRLITFTVTSENGVVIDQTMMVDVQSDANYVANKPVGVKFGANGSTATSVPGSIPIIRLVGPGGTVRLSVAMSDEWGHGSISIGSVPITANENPVRNDTVRDGLSGFARAMGWDTTDAISRRSTAQQRGGKQLEMTALKERLDSELNTRLSELSRSANASSGGSGSSGSNEIMTLIDTMNDRSVDGAAYGAFAGGTGYSTSYGTGAFVGTGADAAGALASAAQVAGQSIYPTDTSGNAGTVYTGVGTDFRSWLAGIGTNKVSGAVRSAVDGAYNAMEERVMEKMPEGMNLWTELTHSDIDFGGANNASFDGSLSNLRMGIEKEYTEKMALGVAVTRFEGDLDHENKPLKLTGTMEVSGWNINPYVLWSGGAARAWVTVGIGSGDMDYTDKQDGNRFNESDSADIDTSMLAAGTEYDLVDAENYEVLARFEAMSLKIKSDAGEKLFVEQDVESYGARGEAEVGWPMNGGDLRPYVTLGYRWDGGDGNGGNSAEFGGGIMMQMKDFTLDGNLRAQTGSDDGDFERTSYSLSFSYDRGNDKRGMMLALSQDRGGAEFDPFSQYATYASNLESGSSSLVADRMNVQAGYGFALDNGLLTFHSTTDFNGGVMGQAVYGFTLETFGSASAGGEADGEGLGSATGIGGRVSTPSRYELLFTTKPAVGATEGQDAVLMKFTKEF